MLRTPLQHPLRGWYIFFLVLSAIDLITTFLLLHFGLVKGNPLAEFLLRHFGLVPVLIGKIALIGLITFGVSKVAKRSPASIDTACNLLIGCVGLMLLLVTMNAALCALTYFSAA